MKWHVRLLFSTVIILLITLFTSSLTPSLTKFFANPNADQPNGIELQAPLFFKTAHAQAGVDFLSNEAGMSAYVNLGKAIDFAALKKSVKNLSIEEETSEYIVGLIKPPGYENLPELNELMDVHFYVHRDGWIIAYLSKIIPTSVMIDFVNYEQQKLNATTLSNVVIKLAAGAGVSKIQLNYYHFGYPEATNLQLVTDVRRADGNDGFYIGIPSTLTVFEKSYIHAAYDFGGSTITLDGQEFANWKALAIRHQWKAGHYTFVDEEQFGPDVNHYIGISHEGEYHSDFSTTLVGLAILYRRG